MGDELETVVVRSYGSGAVHVAEVATVDIVDWQPPMGPPGKVVNLHPVATVCGTKLRRGGRTVVMKDSTVTCKPCARLSGVTEVRP